MGQSHGRPIVYTDQVNLSHFKLLRVVGKGAFGKVRIVERKDDRLTFALKYIRKDEVVKAENVRNIIRERRMLEQLSHPFLCNLRYSFQDFEYLYLVVDLMNGGDLRFHISRKSFTEAAVRFWVAELACAVRYIHSQGIVHRDIKPDNVLLDSDGHVHLADFNVAANYRERPLTSKSGTLAYLAPEVYKGRPYKSEVDWWGLGVTFYECIYGKRPFTATDTRELARQVMRGRTTYPVTAPRVDTSCVHAIKRLMCVEIVDRIGASSWQSFTQHPFFVDIDFAALERKEIPPVFVPSSEKTNFDATYDLEELLLEDAPLEARAKHQKPRPRLKSDATPQEQRTDELHATIEKYFEPFDYKQILFEKNREELEASAKAALLTLPSDAGKIDMALSQARRISAASNRKASIDRGSGSFKQRPHGGPRKPTLSKIQDSSAAQTPSESPFHGSQVDVSELLKSMPRESDTHVDTLDEAVSPLTEHQPDLPLDPEPARQRPVHPKNPGAAARTVTISSGIESPNRSITPDSEKRVSPLGESPPDLPEAPITSAVDPHRTTTPPSAIHPPMTTASTAPFGTSTSSNDTGGTSSTATPSKTAATVSQSQPWNQDQQQQPQQRPQQQPTPQSTEQQRPSKSNQRSLSMGNISAKRRSRVHPAEDMPVPPSATASANAVRIDTASYLPTDLVQHMSAANDGLRRTETDLGLGSTTSLGSKDSKSKGLMGILSRKKRDRSIQRRDQEPGVLGKLGARQILSD